MTARDPVYAALALEPRVVCPFEVAGVRMNLAQLRHTLAGRLGWAEGLCRLRMTDRFVWIVRPDRPGMDRAAAFVRDIRADGVSVIAPAPYKPPGLRL